MVRGFEFGFGRFAGDTTLPRWEYMACVLGAGAADSLGLGLPLGLMSDRLLVSLRPGSRRLLRARHVIFSNPASNPRTVRLQHRLLSAEFGSLLGSDWRSSDDVLCHPGESLDWPRAVGGGI